MNKLVDVGTTALLVGGVLVLTRPNSKGAAFVTALMNGFAHVVQAATGQKLG